MINLDALGKDNILPGVTVAYDGDNTKSVSNSSPTDWWNAKLGVATNRFYVPFLFDKFGDIAGEFLKCPDMDLKLFEFAAISVGFNIDKNSS